MKTIRMSAPTRKREPSRPAVPAPWVRYLQAVLLLLVGVTLRAQPDPGFLRAVRVDPADYSGQLKVTVLDLSEQDQELFMDIEVSMNRDVMNRRLAYVIVPELKSGENTLTGAGILINGQIRDKLYRRKLSFGYSYLVENMPRIKTQVTDHCDTLLRYTLRVPYELWMDDASLDIHQILVSPTGKEQLYTLAGAGRVKLQPREPYIVQPRTNTLAPEPEIKTRQLHGQAYLDFQVGRSVILPAFRRNPEELAKIRSTIHEVTNDPDVQIDNLWITGYASPEGSYASNEKLAQARAQALSDYIVEHFGLATDRMRVGSVAEDWDGLRERVQESDLVRRDEVLAVIDSDDDPDRKEQRLKAMGWPWTAMNTMMFPSLRRVEYQVDYTVKDFTVEEARDLVESNPHYLSQRELFLLAEYYGKGTPQYEQMFETTIRLYPDDPTAIVNYAALLLERGELAAAKRMLDRVADDPRAANNIGVYYLLAGELPMAETFLNTALRTGVEQARHNLNEMNVKKENQIIMNRYNK